MIRRLFLFNIYILFMSFIFSSVNVIYSQGSPPLLVDDTGTPGNGNWEINLIALLEHSKIADEWEAPLLDINYGLGERLQFKVEIPYLFTREDQGKSKSGFEGIEFGVKYRFYGSEDEGTSISCYPQIFSPFDNNEGSEIFLPVECHVQWETIGLTAEIGHGWIKSNSKAWETGIGVGYLFRDTELLLEWHSGIDSDSFELTEPMVNIGFVWDWMETSSLVFSFGKGLRSNNDWTNLCSLGGIQLLL